MGTVRMLARSGMRRRGPSTIALALLVGLIGALVLAAAAGARRSSTALGRFNEYSRSSDLEVSVGAPTAQQLDAFRRSPGVGEFARLHAYSLGVEKYADLAIATPVDDAMGDVVDRSRVISGRQADPSAPEEVTLGESLAADLHLRVGSVLDATSYTQQQITDGFRGKPVGGPEGPRVQLRVVGIVRRPLDLGVRSASGGIVLLTPAFTDKYGKTVGLYTDVLRVRARTPADLPRVEAAARRVFGKAYTFQEEPLGIETEGARNAIDVLTLTLWIFAGVAALAGVVAIGIVLSRDVRRSAVDPATLRALGVTRVQAISGNAVRAVVIGGAGAVVAGILAVALSPRFPVGIARRADPDVGPHADWAVLALGDHADRSHRAGRRTRRGVARDPLGRVGAHRTTPAHVQNRRPRDACRLAARPDQRPADGARAGTRRLVGPRSLGNRRCDLRHRGSHRGAGLRRKPHSPRRFAALGRMDVEPPGGGADQHQPEGRVRRSQRLRTRPRGRRRVRRRDLHPGDPGRRAGGGFVGLREPPG